MLLVLCLLRLLPSLFFIAEKRRKEVSEVPSAFTDATVFVAFALSVFNLWDRIDARIKAAKRPTRALEERIDALESKMDRHDIHFRDDLQRIEQIEEGNKVTQKALLALLSHARDGNNTDQLVKAETELTQYLIDR